MRSPKSSWWLVLSLLVLLSRAASADSLYNEETGGLLGDRLGDHRSTLGIGSEVTVVVNENMIASSGAGTKASKQSNVQASWDFGSLITRVQKSGIQLNGQDQFQGNGTTNRTNTITLLVAATIQEVLPDGSLKIAGKKNLRVNDEDSTVELAGTIRPYDIDASNQVVSTKVANLKLDFKGTGSASAKATPGILTRLLNWLF